MASLEKITRKKGTAYRIRYYLDGKQQPPYYLPLGVTDTEARVILSEFNHKLAKHRAGLDSFQQTEKPQGSMKVSEYWTWFLRTKQAADRTFEIYESAFDLLPDTPVDQIDLEGLTRKLSRYSLNSRSIYIRSLRAAWTFGIKNGILNSNPFLKLEVAQSKKLPHILTIEEKDRIFEKLIHPEARLAFAIARYAGLRRSEILSLTWDDIWWDQDVINIPKAKTGENQKVPLLPDLKKILWDNKGEGIIVNLHPATITHSFKKAMRRAGIKKQGSVHILRHSIGSDLRAQGIDIRDIQDFLRHSSIATTQIYTQLSKKSLHGKLKKIRA